MISLPPLTITRDEPQEVWLLQKARAWLEEQDSLRDPGIHASDLMDPLKAYWRRIDPQPTTERQTWLFVIGRVLHTLVLSMVDPSHVEGASGSGRKEALGISYEPDYLLDGFPVELKTNRSYEEPPMDCLQEEWSIYFEQLVVYLVLHNTLDGALWVLFINLKDAGGRRTFPEPRCYRVSLTETQFADLEQHILETKALLDRALATQSPIGLPLCRTWLCGDACPWFTTRCRPNGRVGRPRKEWTT